MKTSMAVRGLIGAAALACGCAASPFAMNQAHADILGCRTDPVIHLTGGFTVSVNAAIGDSAANVQSVTFNVTLPAWAQGQVKSVTYPGGRLNGESLNISYSGDATQVSSDTSVATSDAAVPVTVGLTIRHVSTDTEYGSSNSSSPIHNSIG